MKKNKQTPIGVNIITAVLELIIFITSGYSLLHYCEKGYSITHLVTLALITLLILSGASIVYNVRQIILKRKK